MASPGSPVLNPKLFPGSRGLPQPLPGGSYLVLRMKEPGEPGQAAPPAVCRGQTPHPLSPKGSDRITRAGAQGSDGQRAGTRLLEGGLLFFYFPPKRRVLKRLGPLLLQKKRMKGEEASLVELCCPQLGGWVTTTEPDVQTPRSQVSGSERPSVALHLPAS